MYTSPTVHNFAREKPELAQSLGSVDRRATGHFERDAGKILEKRPSCRVDHLSALESEFLSSALGRYLYRYEFLNLAQFSKRRNVRGCAQRGHSERRMNPHCHHKTSPQDLSPSTPPSCNTPSCASLKLPDYSLPQAHPAIHFIIRFERIWLRIQEKLPLPYC